MQLGEDPIGVEVNTYHLSSVVRPGWAAACYGEHRKMRLRLGYRRDQRHRCAQVLRPILGKASRLCALPKNYSVAPIPLPARVRVTNWISVWFPCPSLAPIPLTYGDQERCPEKRPRRPLRGGKVNRWRFARFGFRHHQKCGAVPSVRTCMA